VNGPPPQSLILRETPFPSGMLSSLLSVEVFRFFCILVESSKGLTVVVAAFFLSFGFSFKCSPVPAVVFSLKTLSSERFGMPRSLEGEGLDSVVSFSADIQDP